MARNLSPDETALWARVMASVRPLRATPVPAAKPIPKPAGSARSEPVELRPAPKPPVSVARVLKPEGKRLPPITIAAPKAPPRETLDGSWDKKLTRGIVIPDVTIDLHGHTLRSAHDLLDAALARSIARGDRVVLLVTGKPPRPESERPHARGAIRAAIGDWIGASRHAGDIAAIRGAHPRHGGAGALYLVLRRGREPKS